MNRLYYIFGITFFILIFLPIVSAQLIISPVNSDLNVYKGQQAIFSLNLTNNFTYRIYNVSFTQPNAYFGFPVVSSLDPGETRQIAFSVKTDALFSTLYVSTVSFFYPIEYNVSSRSFDVNISDSGYSPVNLTIMQNDTVTWRNLGSNDTQVRDLASGFPSLNVAVGNVNVQSYPNVISYTFYNYPGLGFTGFLNVIPRSNVVMAHDSVLDVPITFYLHSTLNPSTLQFTNVLPSSFTSNNNQTQFGVVEVKNFDNVPLYNVVLSDDRGWINFSLNNFTLAPLQNLLVNFNITPIVSRTVDTNISLPVTLLARSSNGGNGSILVSMTVSYQNFDTVNINGTQYVLNLMNYNATLEACNQHMNEPGFEMCVDFANRWGKNNTVIQEIPAQVTVTEATAKAGWQSIQDVNQGFQRVENLYNRLYDSVQVYTDIANNNTKAELARDARQQSFEEDTNRTIHNNNVRDLIIIIAIITLFIISKVSMILELSEEFRLKMATLQE